MTVTHILVDFENVQPSADDIALVRGDALRLAIFRGPGQMKYSADVAEAWQPLGANVRFIRCAKAGRNAVDMHIAFHLGELIASGGSARFVIVSRDTDFDPLLMHVRGQGYEASRVASIKAALDGRGDRAKAATKTPVTKTASTKTATAKKAGKKSAAKSAAKKAGQATAAAKETSPSPAATATSDMTTKVIENLRRMGDKRPAKRKGLERHLESHLGRKLVPGQLEALMAQLEASGVLAFNDNKVDYRLPKAKK